jgi:MerR family copper efflux transcriptional regulator
MRIGEFARQAGVSASAVRFYEKRGLLPPSARQANGYRHYDADDLRIVRLIDQARSLGFSLRDVARFMNRAPEERRDKRRLVPILADKLALLDQHLAAFQQQRAAIIAFMDEVGNGLAD